MLTSLQQQIASIAQQAGVDPAFALSVAQAESGFSQSAVSPAGAIGVFQLMPATAAGLGVNPNDPTQNIQGGVAYLSQLLNQYGGNQTLALAAYNAGPGNVAKYGGVPPFSETQSYVQSVLGNLANWAGVAGSAAPVITTDAGTGLDDGYGPLDAGTTTVDSLTGAVLLTGAALALWFILE